jgi:stress-induced morphogen
MPIAESKLRAILEEKFPNAQLEIKDLVGDQDHYSITIYSAEFEGLSLLQRHKLVNKALGDVLKQELHAVTINPKTA